MTSISITDEFDSPYGRLDNYDTVLGGYPAEPTFTDNFISSAVFSSSYSITPSISSSFRVNGGYLESTTTSTYSAIYKGYQYDNNQVIVKTRQILAGTYNLKLGVKVDSTQLNGLFVFDSGSALTLYKRVAGVDTSTGATVAYSRTVGTDYWLLVKISGSALTGQIWTTDPTLGGSALATVTIANLSAVGLSSYIEGFRGYSGIIGVSHTVALGYRLDYISVSPIKSNLYDPTTLDDLNIFNKHVDIRAFINDTTYRSIRQSELGKYHQWESAYAQVLGATPSPTSGKFTLGWTNEKGADSSVRLNWNVTQAQLQTAVRNITGYADITVSGTSFPFTINFASDTPYLPLLWITLNDLKAGVSVSTATVTVANSDTLFLQTASDADISLTQDNLQHIKNVTNEDWTLTNFTTNTNLYDQTALVIGRTASKGYWNALTMSFATPFDGCYLTSSMPTKPVNLAANVYTDPARIRIEMAVPGISSSAVDIASTSSGVQFTSDPAGKFGNGFDSALIPFAGNIDYSGGNAIVSFALGASSGNLDLSKITGVRLSLKGSGVAGGQFVMLNMRAFFNKFSGPPWISWVETNGDINTITKTLSVPSSRYGDLAVNSSYQKFIPLLRTNTGDPDKSPRASDGALSMKFNTGNLSAGAPNRLQLLFREVLESTTVPLRDTQTWMTAELDFGIDYISLKRYATQRIYESSVYTDSQIGSMIDNVQSAPTAPATNNRPVSGTLAPLKPNTDYLFQGEVQGNGFRVAIYELDGTGIINFSHYDTDFASDPLWTRVTGRSGWFADFVNQDVTLDYFRASSTTYSIFRTVVFASRTPVIGARIETASSDAQQFFSNFISTEGDPLEIDAGYSSEAVTAWKFTGLGVNQYSGMKSNPINFDDWENMSITLDLQIPSDMLASGKEPLVYLVPIDSGGDIGSFNTIGPISLSATPNSFSHNRINFGPYRFRATGYYEVFVVSEVPHSSVWWIKDMRIQKRTVVWEMRAKSNGAWISFEDMINDTGKALSIGRDNRGTELQLQARALTDNAWISEYKLFPKYAELGRTILL
jgi:hypothetical protein